MKTRAIFRMWPESEGGGCIAFLPDLPANDTMIMSYEHVGQHSEASPECCNGLRDATREERADLEVELCDIYGVLEILHAIPRKRGQAAA